METMSDTRAVTEAAVIKRAAYKARTVDAAARDAIIAELQAVMARREPFAARVDIRLDDEQGFVIDGPNRAVVALGAPAECRFHINPLNLSHVAQGKLDPRMAILFSQLQMQDGAMRTAVAFGDWLADRRVTLGSPTNQALPTPTRDRDRLRHDLEAFGYALVEEALTPEDVKGLRQRVMEQAAGEQEAGVASVSEGAQVVWALLNKGRVFHDLLLNPLIDEFVPEVLGEHPILTGIVSIIATPGGKTTTMHLDQSFVQPAIPQFQTGLNILWFLDDVTEANGGTRIMPASHLGGVAPADPSSAEGTIAAEGPAGTALLLDSRVWHATGNNRTDKPRHLAVTYLSRAFMRAQENYFLSLRPELEDSLDEKVRIMLGYRCTASLGAVEGPIEGKMNRRPAEPVGELKPASRSGH